MLAVVETKAPRILYRVGKHSPGLAAYPIWARWLIRLVYFSTGYQVTSEDIGIATTPEQAESMCLDSTYFYKPLYVDSSLPPEQCAPGPVVWPHSEAGNLYKRHTPDAVIVPRREWNLLQDTVQEFCRTTHR